MAFLFWLIRYRVQRFVANIYLFIASWESVFHNVVRSAMLDRCQIGEKLIKISLQFTESTLSKWFGEKYICRLKNNCNTLQFYKSQHNLSWTFAVWENVFDMLQIIFLSPNAEKKNTAWALALQRLQFVFDVDKRKHFWISCQGLLII